MTEYPFSGLEAVDSLLVTIQNHRNKRPEKADTFKVKIKALQLRKAGNLEEAWNTVSALTKLQRPLDLNERQALGYVLCSLIQKEAESAEPKPERIAAWRSLLAPIEINDEYFPKAKARALALRDPAGKERAEAQSLQKKGDYAGAIRLYETRIIPAANDDSRLKDLESLGWNLFRRIQELLRREPFGLEEAKEIRGCFVSYYRQTLLHTKSTLHSAILSQLLRFSRKLQNAAPALNISFTAAGFLLNCGFDNLRDEDWQPHEPWMALAEDAIQSAGKELSKKTENGDNERFLPWLECGIQAFPNNFWLRYYRAKLLIALGRNQEAEADALAVAREKKTESWAWSLLAGSFPQNSDKQLACLCRAMLCPDKSETKQPVRKSLVFLLTARKAYPEAKAAAQDYLNVRAAQTEKAAPAVEALKRSAWWNECAADAVISAFYRGHAALADELITADIPWIDAVAGESFKRKESNQLRRALYLIHGSSLERVSIPERDFAASGCSQRQALSVKAQKQVDGRWVIFQVRQGLAESLTRVPERMGVITGADASSECCYAVSETMENVRVPWTLLGQNAGPGATVRLRLFTRDSDNGHKTTVITARICDEKAPASLLKTVEGPLKNCGSFGFIEDAWVSPPLMEKWLSAGAHDEKTFRALAVRRYDRTKEKWGWAAISLCPAED